MKGLVLRVMHTKFGQNWPTTFIDVENVNYQRTTRQMQSE